MVRRPVHALFDFGEGPFWTLVGEFRRRIFEEVARSDLSGLIFTYVWALDREERLNTDGAFPWSDHFVRVDNEQMTPAEAAARIRVALGLPSL